ncbi:MAG: tRNA (adenosine(37)-N6)-threonylcarbamoyltransferase complex ATPase subunit type 1 TsaE [Ruminococcaceae bacterium]|nr:tRNA (adenosine(37)-N6)-threonylcarbamoyltransferase complex ATPase subunit type 1 TsaE [Oscillospiraceae bacterium]
MTEIINSYNTSDTEECGAYLARLLGEKYPDSLWLVCLKGDLGAGKTAFVRGFASVISPGSRVKSPTYTVVNEYRMGDVPLFHFDLYRLEDSDDGLESIGFEQYLSEGHCIIEWSEFLPSRPSDAVEVYITKQDENGRCIRIII